MCLMKSGFCLSVAMVLLLTATSASQDGASERRLRASAQPIVTALRASDRHVVIEIDAFPPSRIGPEPDVPLIQFYTERSDAVITVRVESTNPRFVRRDLFDRVPVAQSQADWITTDVRARIERVMKNSSALLIQEDGQFTFQQDGGSVMIGLTRVDAVIPWQRSFTPGNRYLIFGEVHAEKFFPVWSYEISTNGRLASTWVEMPIRRGVEYQRSDDLEQMTLDEALFRVSQGAEAR